ncbi:MAG: sigma-70 family RNA polymerase sigma factor [Bacteroidota bacterium]
MNPHSPSEAELLAGCLEGQRKAQRTLYEQYQQHMFAVCLRYAPNRVVAEDLLQEGFYRVFKELGSYRGEGALGGWIRKVIVRTALDFLKKERRDWARREKVGAERPESWDGESALIGQMGADFILELLQKLPAGYRAVFNLYAIEGYSHREISEQLGIAESTSRSQYVRARQMLAQQLTSLDKTL